MRRGLVGVLSVAGALVVAAPWADASVTVCVGTSCNTQPVALAWPASFAAHTAGTLATETVPCAAGPLDLGDVAVCRDPYYHSDPPSSGATVVAVADTHVTTSYQFSSRGDITETRDVAVSSGGQQVASAGVCSGDC